MTWPMLPYAMLMLGFLAVFVIITIGVSGEFTRKKTARVMLVTLIILLAGPFFYWGEAALFYKIKVEFIKGQRDRGEPIDPRDITDMSTCRAAYEGTKMETSCYMKY